MVDGLTKQIVDSRFPTMYPATVAEVLERGYDGAFAANSYKVVRQGLPVNTPDIRSDNQIYLEIMSNPDSPWPLPEGLLRYARIALRQYLPVLAADDDSTVEWNGYDVAEECCVCFEAADDSHCPSCNASYCTACYMRAQSCYVCQICLDCFVPANGDGPGCDCSEINEGVERSLAGLGPVP